MDKEDTVNIIGVGKLLKSKGFDRVLRITKQLIAENYSVHTYILGEGPEKEDLQNYIENNGKHQTKSTSHCKACRGITL